MKLVFGEWLPDQPALDNPGATVAMNVLPYTQTYGSLPSLSSFSTALNAACVGSITVQASNGIIHNHAGSGTQLMALNSGKTFNNVSKSGDYTNVEAWEWTRYGDRIITVSGHNREDPQFFDLNTGNLYADLAGTPPKAATIATVRNFIVLGGTNDGTTRPNRVVWSGYNNTELWDPSAATQSDFRDLTGDGGDIQRIVPGQYGVIFQKNSIWTMEYVGPPTIWRFNEVEEGRGTPAPHSVCWTGQDVFYLGQDGFYRWRGGASTPIGAEKVDRWFYNEADEFSVNTLRGVVDRTNRIVMWAFKSSIDLTYNDRLLIYNWAVDRWSYAEIDTEVISEYLTADVNLDGLSDILTDGIDIDSIPVDSVAYRGGRVSMIAFDTDHKASTFSGAALGAVLETKEFGRDDRRRTVLKTVRPLVDGASTTVTVQSGTRNQQNANYSYSLAKSENALGEYNFRSNARYHRLRVNTSGNFNDAFGVDIDLEASSMR